MENLVDKYIKEDNKEKLWYLVFEHGNKVDINKIMNYYIEEKDSYYVCELISIADEYIDLNKVANKIIDKNDITFAYMILKNGVIQDIVNSNFISKLRKFCDKI